MRMLPESCATADKSLLLLFSRKEDLSFLTSTFHLIAQHGGRSQGRAAADHPLAAAAAPGLKPPRALSPL
jgi:hypothetical protein